MIKTIEIIEQGENRNTNKTGIEKKQKFHSIKQYLHY
jgi:hypothetical protein